MDLSKCLAVLIVLFVDSGESGGHGGKHHDHVKLHMPEFIHHDHHTKVITIHHHHHKPKKEHHHHHHHHHQPKPHIPQHHYNHHHHKTTLKTTTVSKGHKQVGHGHSGHHGHHSHHGGGHGSHYGHHGPSHHDSPSYNHNVPSISHDPGHVSFEDDFKSFTPSIPVNIPHNPHVHGVVHTVKQVKVFDSLPGSIKSNSGSGSNGYEVTEEGEEGDEDAFTSVNTIPQTYPGTYGFVRSAAPQAESYPGLALQSSVQLNHDPFAAAPGPSAFSGLENFSSDGQDFSSSLSPQGTNGHALPEFAGQTEQISGFDDAESFVGNDISGTALLSAEANDDTPVTYSREAGIQHSLNTGGIQTVEY
ncbi:PREDICTED: protein doublesex-like [Papilio polytes]|uniref:protein doublesex-like n=1 Tax=Papilio polytes TaxID=76194 RepID=UPI000675CB9E|nr:PREDICTED: protein doublesex-like [Papilio polytes]